MSHFFWLASLPCQLMLWTLLHVNHTQRQPVQLTKENNKRSTWGNVWKRCMNHFVHESLSLVWPKSKEEPGYPDDICTPILANEHYLCSMPTTHCDGYFNATWDSHTPSHASTMLCYVTQCTLYLHNTMMDTLILFTVQHMVSYHSSNSTHPKWCPRVKNVPSTLAHPNLGNHACPFCIFWLLCKQRGEEWPPLVRFAIPCTPLNFWLVKGMKRALKHVLGRLFRGSKVMENVEMWSHSCQCLWGPYIQWDRKHSDAD